MQYRDSILRELSFVSLKQTGMNFWLPAPGVTWEQGCLIGRERAEQFLRFIRMHQDPVLLTRVGGSMIGETGYNSVETAFTHRLAEACITGR